MMGEQLHDKADVLRGDAEHLDRRRQPSLPRNHSPSRSWSSTNFSRRCVARHARTTRIAAMKQMREELLARELVPGLHARGGTTIGEYAGSIRSGSLGRPSGFAGRFPHRSPYSSTTSTTRSPISAAPPTKSS